MNSSRVAVEEVQGLQQVVVESLAPRSSDSLCQSLSAHTLGAREHVTLRVLGRHVCVLA